MNTATDTIGSLELATLADKRHANVKRTMNTLAKHGHIKLTQIEQASVMRSNGRSQKLDEYHVNKRDSHVIMAQLSPLYAGKLVDRWSALEEGRTTPLGFTPDVRDFDAEIASLPWSV